MFQTDNGKEGSGNESNDQNKDDNKTGITTVLNKFNYVATNAKNDPNAPSYFGGLFRGYLAFDTGQPFHYRVF